MPKNIVICSDGTGNSGSKANGTNVWRTFQAIDREHATCEQVAYYDDGVGTEDFKIFKALGGALGWGITRNLEQLYGFLIREFDPGDQIYMFGFSRGAFTVRTLANVLYYCGIAKREGMSPKQLDELASTAIRAYKSRDFKVPDCCSCRACQFRQKHGLEHAEDRGDPNSNVAKERKGRFPIRFVGVWDTVDAVALPFDELTVAFAEMPILKSIFGLSLHRPGETYSPEWENDLKLVQHAAHAIALDDERKTFHPTMMIQPPGTAASQRHDGIETSIQQVWFAGMHTNVGGGYPKDEMALVPLIWMLNKAKQADLVGPQSLKLLDSLVKEYQRDSDSEGKLYDSRSGLAAYYRYSPRDVKRLMQQVAPESECDARIPRIHESVLERIQSRIEDYAPIGIPEVFQVEPWTSPLGTCAKNHASERRKWHDATDGPVFIRKVLYYSLLLLSVLLLAVLPGAGLLEDCWLAKWDPRCCQWSWITAVVLAGARMIHSVYDRRKTVERKPITDDWWSDFGASSLKFVGTAGFVALALMLFQNTLLAIAAFALPDMAKEYLAYFDRHPFLLLCFVLLFYAILEGSLSAQRAIRELSSQAWAMVFGTATATEPSGFSKRLSAGVRCMSKFTHGITTLISRFVLPLLLVLAVIAALAYGLVRSWCNATDCSSNKGCCSPAIHPHVTSPTTVEFSTKNPNFPTGFCFVKDQWYEITVTPRSVVSSTSPASTVEWDWLDASLKATPAGLTKTTSLMWLLTPLRRVQGQPWFRLMGSVHDDLQAHHFPIESGTTFQAPATGELHLFVNDACPCLGSRFYKNNEGTAVVTIKSRHCPTERVNEID